MLQIESEVRGEKRENDDNSPDLRSDRPMIVKTGSLSDLDTRPNNMAAQLRLLPTWQQFFPLSLTQILSSLSLSFCPCHLNNHTVTSYEIRVEPILTHNHVSSQHLLQVTSYDPVPDFSGWPERIVRGRKKRWVWTKRNGFRETSKSVSPCTTTNIFSVSLVSICSLTILFGFFRSQETLTPFLD